MWLKIILSALTGANIIAFAFWYSLIEVYTVDRDKIPDYFYDAISLQISILAAVTGVGVVVLAGIAIFGYEQIKNLAVAKAEEAVREHFEARADTIAGGLSRYGEGKPLPPIEEVAPQRDGTGGISR